MRRLPCSFLVTALLVAAPAMAQTPTSPAAPAPAQRPDSRIEHITNEDALTRIDELRVGGQTQSIDVQPKNGAPAYEIKPQPNAPMPGETGGKPTGNAGRSSWRVLNF